MRNPLLDCLRGPRGPLALLGLVSLLSLGARLWRLDKPSGALIFDEQYYVNAARVILGWHVPDHANYAGSPPGIDPNHEHPPLGKLFIVAGMRLFGDNAWGWRSFALLFGTLAILLMYWVVRSAGGNRSLALGAATLMAVDNLSLVQGRIATLDVFVVVFMLLAAGLYLRGTWRLAIAGGLALGLALTVKTYGGELVLVLAVFELLLLRQPGLRDRLLRVGVFAAVGVATYLVALLAMDAAMHAPTINPLQHTRDMFSYASGLKSPAGPQGIASSPWDWLLNQKPINYYSVNTDISSGGKVIATHPVVAFQGLMNPFVIFLALPAFALSLWLAVRERDRLGALAAAWCLGTFLPFAGLAVFGQRTEYLYYMVVILPGVYLAVARLFSRRFLPTPVTVGWVFALGYGFWSLYPFRTWGGP